MSKIFFSYSTKNQAVANQVTDSLIAAGFIIWQDWRNIEAADNWMEIIEQGLQESSAFILLWSADAAASKWVTQETQIILNEKDKSFKFISICLDNTPLPTALKLRQALKLPESFKEDDLKKVVKAIEKSLSPLCYPALGFRFDQKLGDQVHSPHTAPLVSVPFLDGGLSQVSIVGSANLVVAEPPIVQLCLQMTRSVSENMVGEVWTTVQSLKFHDEPIEFVGIHIVGPNDGTIYTLDNYRPAEWANALGAVKIAVDRFLQGIGGTKPVLQIFIQGPAVLGLAIGRTFDKYWRIQLYNWVLPKDRKDPTDIYRLVIDQT